MVAPKEWTTEKRKILRINPELHNQLKVIATQSMLTLEAYVTQVLQDSLRK